MVFSFNGIASPTVDAYNFYPGLMDAYDWRGRLPTTERVDEYPFIGTEGCIKSVRGVAGDDPDFNLISPTMVRRMPTLPWPQKNYLLKKPPPNVVTCSETNNNFRLTQAAIDANADYLDAKQIAVFSTGPRTPYLSVGLPIDSVELVAISPPTYYDPDPLNLDPSLPDVAEGFDDSYAGIVDADKFVGGKMLSYSRAPFLTGGWSQPFAWYMGGYFTADGVAFTHFFREAFDRELEGARKAFAKFERRKIVLFITTLAADRQAIMAEQLALASEVGVSPEILYAVEIDAAHFRADLEDVFGPL